MITFVRKLNWRNKSEGKPDTLLFKEDLFRYENGIGDLADLVNEGRLSEADLNGTYAPVGAVGLDEAALAASISNPETASNSAVVGIVAAAIPAGLMPTLVIGSDLTVARPVGHVGPVEWVTTSTSGVPVHIANGDIIARVTPTVVPFSPAQVPNVVGWWDAQSIAGTDGAALPQWNDLSGNVRHAVQATGGAQPIYRASGINAHPAIQFDGTDDILAADFVAPSLTGGTWTVYAVGHDTRATATASKFLFDGFTTASLRLALSRSSTNTFVMQRGTAMGSPPAADANPHRFKAVYNGASSSLTVDSNAPVTGTVGTTPTEAFTRFTLGGRSDLNNFFQGFLGEIVIVSGLVSAGDDTKMTTYLTGRWGVA